MDFDVNETIVLKDGAIVLRHRMDRGDPRVWQATYKLPDGGTQRKSTKVRDREEAKRIALEYHDELRWKKKLGFAYKTKKFSDIATDYKKSLWSLVQLGDCTKENYDEHCRIIDRYLVPYFGKKDMDGIRTAEIAKFVDWRKAFWETGPGSKIKHVVYERNGQTIKRPVQKPKVPAKFVVEFVCLRLIFTEAVKQGVVNENQIPILKYKEPARKKVARREKRRPAFSMDVWTKIKRNRIKFVKAGSTDQNKERRALMYDFIDFLTACGARPGKETNQLCWKHISETIIDGKTYVEVLIPKSKTKEREVLAMPRCRIALQNIAKRRYAYIQWFEQDRGNEPLDELDDYVAAMNPEEKIFCLADGTFQSKSSLRPIFETMLKFVDVVFAANGKKYSLYSCRHTYATVKLRSGTNIAGLTKNMGTSIQMLDEYYGQVQARDVAEDLGRDDF